MCIRDSYHSFSGEYGGLWRRNGRPPQKILGVGFTAQGFDISSHYVRNPDSYKEKVSAGIQWLRQQQDYETGLFGEKIGHTYMYSHSIASLAMCEAYYFSKNPILKGTTQKAINFIIDLRNRLDVSIPRVDFDFPEVVIAERWKGVPFVPDLPRLAIGPARGTVFQGIDDIFPDIARLSVGTGFFRGGLAMMGELGPELAMLPRGALRLRPAC